MKTCKDGQLQNALRTINKKLKIFIKNLKIFFKNLKIISKNCYVPLYVLAELWEQMKPKIFSYENKNIFIVMPVYGHRINAAFCTER
jgi:hypothetical protein